MTPINDCEFYESVDAPTEFNYLKHKVEVYAFTVDGAGFRPSWWAGVLVTKAGWLGMQLLALRSMSCSLCGPCHSWTKQHILLIM